MWDIGGNYMGAESNYLGKVNKHATTRTPMGKCFANK